MSAQSGHERLDVAALQTGYSADPKSLL